MRIVFMGSGALGCPVARALLAAHGQDAAGAVTPPDGPKGQARLVAACAVKDEVAATGR